MQDILTDNKGLIGKIIALYKKYRELIWYVIIGGCTTVVNFVVYKIDMSVFNMDRNVNLVVSWIAAVIFAYITNKVIVFKSECDEKLKEFIKFISSRIASLIIEIVLMALCVDVIGWGEWFSKFPVAIFVVIVNYVLSKLWVFAKK